MNVVTHALLPALLATPVLPRTSRGDFLRAAGIVVLGGALPDLVNPHLTLAARYSSWSHTVFALAGFGVLLCVLVVVTRRHIAPRVAVLVWLGLGLHLTCDAISGGIVPLYPVGDVLVSRRYVPYPLWWWCDAACGLAAIVVLAAVSARFEKRSRNPESHSTNHSPQEAP